MLAVVVLLLRLFADRQPITPNRELWVGRYNHNVCLMLLREQLKSVSKLVYPLLELVVVAVVVAM